MTSLSPFIAISYSRDNTIVEKTLSTLSNYFYLGGTRVTVIKANETYTRYETQSWKIIAIKVASYILFAPITAILFSINLALLSKYKFTDTTPSSLPSNSEEAQLKDQNPQQANYKYFNPAGYIFDEVKSKKWYIANEEIDISIGTLNSISNRINRGKYDNDFASAIEFVSSSIDTFLENNKKFEEYREEISEFKQILIDQFDHLEYNQKEVIRQRQEEESKVAYVSRIPKTHVSITDTSILEYGKVLRLQEYHGYKLISSNLICWTQFCRKEHASDNIKFHVSLERDPLNISQAFKCVIPIFEKYKIASFKIIKLDAIQSTGGNDDGKELVIYIQDEENNKELWARQILPEILDIFKQMNIQCGNYSKADIPISGGEGFFYARSPYNQFGLYILAQQLESNGFSRFESAYISEYPLLEICLNNGQPITEDKIELTSNNKLIRKVPKQEIEDIKKSFDKIIGDKSLLTLITGSNIGYLAASSDNNRIVMNLIRKYANNVGNFNNDKVCKVLQSATLKSEIFDPYFQATSIVTAQLRRYYNINTSVGNIRPALYQHFIKDHEIPFTEDKRIATVKDLVLCALRNPEIIPAMPVQADDELLTELVIEALNSGRAQQGLDFAIA